MKPLLPLLASAFFAAPALRAELPSLAVPVAATPPAIDGDLADVAWQTAAVIEGLSPPSDASRGSEGIAPRPFPTTVRVLWDAEALCVAFSCTDPDVFSTGTLGHDDNLYMEDVVEVFLDPAGNGRAFAEIQVSPEGRTLDIVHLYTADPEPLPDGRIRPDIVKAARWSMREWEWPGAMAAAKRTDTGWQAELRLPLAPFLAHLGRDALTPGMELRIQFVRYDHDGDALLQQTWSPCPLGNPHNCPSLFGTLRLRTGNE